MALTLLALVGLAIVGGWWWMARSGTPERKGARPTPARPAAATPTALPRSTTPQPLTGPAQAGQSAWADLIAPAGAAPGTDPTAERPAPLALHPAELLDPLLTETLMNALRQLPRPPRALQQLISPDFVQHATSAELATLVMGEPAVAARVIATANSPLYGLQQPVTSIGQATTFLGLANVRQMCLQHMLAESFQPRDATQRREFDVLRQASSIAAELCQQLAPRLRVADTGSLATLLVLSFLGRQAAVALLPDTQAVQGMDAYQRALHEQQELGLVSHELGHLLMRAWELPPELIHDARLIAALRFNPKLVLPAGREAGLTLAAVSALLGERLARGQLGGTLYDPAGDDSPDMRALRHRLLAPPLDALGAELRSPALLRLLGRLLGRPD